jgi:type III restriction enzyme
MIVLKDYQKKTVESLSEHFFNILESQSIRIKRRERIVFKAPTGAGKTVMMATLLQKVNEELPLRLNLQNRDVAFIWISSNKLHEQSQMALAQHFSVSRAMRCISSSDIVDNQLDVGDILFLNWESVYSKNNTWVQEGERGDSLYEMLENTRKQGIELVVIIDEAHQKTTGEQCQKVLRNIDAVIEFEVSATPKYISDYSVSIPRIAPIQAQMIKKGVHLNPKVGQEEGEALNEILIKEALKKREQLEKAYAKQGSKVRPLLLIQLPNDQKEDEDQEDARIHEQVVTSLKAKGISTENAKLGIWLSKEKIHCGDEVIKPFDSTVEVLLFKQAIALGWDCPRAAVLLIFRAHKGGSFTIQTVGRILRMPEQKHYTDDTLNYGYVYTDLSRDEIVIGEDSKDYLTKSQSKRLYFR